MPATITHAFFAKDVYEILPSEIRNCLNLNRCKTFGQSTDALMFYNLFLPLPGKKIRKIQSYSHSHQTQEFFINMLSYMKENKIQDEDSYSLLVGFICHYILDSIFHPYVIYRSGLMKKGKPDTYKYNNLHGFIETFFDMDMVKRRLNVNPYRFNFGKFCFDLRPFSNDLKKVIDYTFDQTFHLKKMPSIYYRSLKQMKIDLNLFRRDPYGIKKVFYKLADTITPRSVYRFEVISYHYPLEDHHDYLNKSHRLWRNPVIYDMTSTETFADLYIKALKQAKVVICASFDYLNGKSIDLTQIFPNTSYVTGLNCDLKKGLKYFEF